jgi:hypothetical protein
MEAQPKRSVSILTLAERRMDSMKEGDMTGNESNTARTEDNVPMVQVTVSNMDYGLVITRLIPSTQKKS